jgi:hypothetical protein
MHLLDIYIMTTYTIKGMYVEKSGMIGESNLQLIITTSIDG